MVEITILYFEGCPSWKIALENIRRAIDLLETYQQAIAQLDEGIVETFLLHSTKDGSLWQIVTVWENRGVLHPARMNGAGGKSRGGMQTTLKKQMSSVICQESKARYLAEK